MVKSHKKGLKSRSFRCHAASQRLRPLALSRYLTLCIWLAVQSYRVQNTDPRHCIRHFHSPPPSSATPFYSHLWEIIVLPYCHCHIPHLTSPNISSAATTNCDLRPARVSYSISICADWRWIPSPSHLWSSPARSIAAILLNDLTICALDGTTKAAASCIDYLTVNVGEWYSHWPAPLDLKPPLLLPPQFRSTNLFFSLTYHVELRA